MTAATQLLVELLLEGLAQQVEGKWVEAGVCEGQDTSYDAAHKVNQGSVHLAKKNELYSKRNVQNICAEALFSSEPPPITYTTFFQTKLCPNELSWHFLSIAPCLFVFFYQTL